MTFEGPIPPNYSNREPSEYVCPQCGSSNCEEPPNFPGFLQCEDCGFGAMADDFESGESDEDFDGSDDDEEFIGE